MNTFVQALVKHGYSALLASVFAYQMALPVRAISSDGSYLPLIPAAPLALPRLSASVCYAPDPAGTA